MHILNQRELDFFNKVSKDINTIFDVGTSFESIYLQSNKIVHYFEPNELLINELKKEVNNNSKSFFNNFGLSDVNGHLNFYTDCSSYSKRPYSKSEPILLPLMRGDEYMDSNSVEIIDLLKIDVECLESNVFRGFGDKLNNVKLIQFEYGSGQSEVGDNLRDMVNYLKSYGFVDFNYMFPEEVELVPIVDLSDTWRWCNIVAYNSKYFDERPW